MFGIMSIMIGISSRFFFLPIVYDWKYYFTMLHLCAFECRPYRVCCCSCDFAFVFEEFHIKLVVYCNQLTNIHTQGQPGDCFVLGLPARIGLVSPDSFFPPHFSAFAEWQARALGANLEPPHYFLPLEL